MSEKLYLIVDRTGRDGSVQELKIEIKIIGQRSVFGRDEVEVSPVAGSGAWWVRKDGLICLDPNLKSKVVK